MHKVKRIAIILAMGVALFILSQTFVAVDITQRAVVVGLGIDFDTTNNLYQVCAEIVATGQTDQSTGVFTKMVSAKGETVAQAIINLSTTTGKEMSLGQTMVIMLGEEATKAVSAQQTLAYFDVSNAFKEGTILVSCKGTALDFFQQKPATSASVSFALAQLFPDDHWQAVQPSVLLRFLEKQISVGNTGFINVVNLIEQKEIGSSTEQSDKKPMLYQIDSCAVFKQNQFVETLANNSHVGFSLLCDDVVGQNYRVPYDGDRPNYMPHVATVTLHEKKVDVQTEGDNKVKIKFEMTVKQSKTDDYYLGSPLTPESYNELTKSMLSKVEEQAKVQIESFVDFCKENDVDVFGFSKAFYRKNGEKWRQLNLSVKDFDFEIEVKAKE